MPAPLPPEPDLPIEVVIGSVDEELLGPGREPRHRRPRESGPGGALAGRLRRVPAPAWVGLALALVAALVAGQLLTAHPSTPSARPPAVAGPPAATGSTGTGGSTDSAEPSPPGPTASPVDLEQLIYNARAVEPAVGIGPVAAGRTCPTPPAAVDPSVAVGRVIDRSLPGFTVTASAATTNPNGTLCGLIVRADGPDGEVLIIQVTAPALAIGATFWVERSQGPDTALDVAARSDGWQVEVGWAGPTVRAVSYDQLAALADEPGLRW